MSYKNSNDGIDLLYKILVVGDVGAGKTSIIKRYVHGIYTSHYKSTVGVDFAIKVIKWDYDTIIRLQLWDIAGQERFGNMTRIYYKEAVGAFVVFDVTRISTFDGVKKWKKDIDSKLRMANGIDLIPIILLANKIDLVNDGESWGKTKEFMDDYCKEHGFVSWFETSAKDNVMIDDASKNLVETIFSLTPNFQKNKDNTIIIDKKEKEDKDECMLCKPSA